MNQSADHHTTRTKKLIKEIEDDQDHSMVIHNTDANEQSVIMDINKDDEILDELNHAKSKSRRFNLDRSKRNKSNNMRINNLHKNNLIDDEKNYYIQKIKKNIEMKIKNSNLNLESIEDYRRKIKNSDKVSEKPASSFTRSIKKDFTNNVITLESLNSNDFKKENIDDSCFITQQDIFSQNTQINIKNV